MNWFRCLLMVVVLQSANAKGQTTTVREFLAQPDSWAALARDRTEISLNGRFGGRVSRQFRLQKLPIVLFPERTAVLPSSIKADDRITIAGKLRKSGTRFEMDVNRIAVGASDLETFERQAIEAQTKGVNDTYELADRFQLVADFYDDVSLKEAIIELRQATFDRERKSAAGKPEPLRKLIEVARQLQLPPDVSQTLKFESLVAARKLETFDRSELLKRVRDELEGWDSVRRNLPQDLVQQYRDAPISAYSRGATEQRLVMHRLLYRDLRLPLILQRVKSDGSNAGELADLLRKELPEEKDAIRSLNERYLKYRLDAIPRLSRRQLSDLEQLLQQVDRAQDFQPALDRWLNAQEKRLNNGQLDGLLETADQFTFAFERWKQSRHSDRAVLLFKQAWDLSVDAAPEEARKIETRLEQLGWVRLRDTWMTSDAVAALPENDVALAMKEGRVVSGMGPKQVVAILGQPARKIRVASKGTVDEIWIFGDADASAITVQLSRSSYQSPDRAIVRQVSRTAR